MRFMAAEVIREKLMRFTGDELPYSRNQRTMVYQRSKDEGGVRPFGSLEKMYENDFVWLNHSITPSNISGTS